MKLTVNNIRKIKSFLRENLNQPISEDLIHSMFLNNTLKQFFYENLVPYIAPDTSEVVRLFIFSLKVV